MLKNNALTLEKELKWFDKVLGARVDLYFKNDTPIQSIHQIQQPDPTGDPSPYARFIRAFNMNFDERVVLILSLIPHVRPQCIDIFFSTNQEFSRQFTEFGGWKGLTHGGFLPTGETAAFILAGADLEKRFDLIKIFDDRHFFTTEKILGLERNGSNEPFFSGALTISPEFLSLFTTGVTQKPDYNINFPAKLITTRLSWDDLVLPPDVFEEIDSINGWGRHSKTIMETWGLKKIIKPGYHCLFHGPPGTGKTLTASLIGAAAGADVYRIDLSMVVSKYIGETEKNLANVFDQAEKKNWILFFDEADALFGRRTQTTSSNDRYANQEVSYLLQRVEDFPGVVILATNLKSNIDDAFARRFQSVIYFPPPDQELRHRLWTNILKKSFYESADHDLEGIAEKYELTGGSIVNVVRYAAIKALQRGRKAIGAQDLIKGISKELMKEGKTL